MNNFEKIKSMSIDDLAIFLSTFAYTCGETEYNQEDYLIWLQQESEEE